MYSVYTLIGASCVRKANGLGKKEYALILKAWEDEIEDNAYLKTLVQLARETQYDGLRKIFEQSACSTRY